MLKWTCINQSINRSLTDGDRVDFAFDLNRAILTLVDVDCLLHLGITDHQIPVVLLVLLCSIAMASVIIHNVSDSIQYLLR